jgi:Fic family protein
VPALIDDWAAFANAPVQLPITIQAALLHYQFETIHPFGDGNGRLGRILVKLFFFSREVLRQPFLYLSGYLLRNRAACNDSMLAVSRSGAWSGWVTFFARGIAEQARQTASLAHDLVELYRSYVQTLDTAGAPGTVYHLLDVLFEHQTITSTLVMDRLGVTAPTARKAIATLVELGILTEQTGKQRYREYAPEAVVRLFE